MRSAKRCSRTRSLQRITPRSASWARVACTNPPERPSIFVSSRVLRSRRTSRRCSPKSLPLLLPPLPPLLLHLVRHLQEAATRMYRCQNSRCFVFVSQIEAGNELFVLYCVCEHRLSGADLHVNCESASPFTQPSPLLSVTMLRSVETQTFIDCFGAFPLSLVSPLHRVLSSLVSMPARRHQVGAARGGRGGRS